jgi:hypothetical protein
MRPVRSDVTRRAAWVAAFALCAVLIAVSPVPSSDAHGAFDWEPLAEGWSGWHGTLAPTLVSDAPQVLASHAKHRPQTVVVLFLLLVELALACSIGAPLTRARHRRSAGISSRHQERAPPLARIVAS